VGAGLDPRQPGHLTPDDVVESLAGLDRLDDDLGDAVELEVDESRAPVLELAQGGMETVVAGERGTAVRDREPVQTRWDLIRGSPGLPG
jgi:hypothetical protein